MKLAVRVTRETDEEIAEFGGLLERCEGGCGKFTRYWWADGCFALCPDCAQVTTRERCIEHAKKHGYGPLPSQQYYLKRKEKLREQKAG